jgi:tetratricopeptide (TPR) repeat protein
MIRTLLEARGKFPRPIDRPSPPLDPARQYERYAGFHVVRLAGDPYAMGWQHGALLKDAIARGPLPAFSKYVARMVELSAPGSASAIVAKVANEAMWRSVGRTIAAHFPEDACEAIEGLAQGADLDREELWRAVTMPETYLFGIGAYLTATRPFMAPRLSVPTFGCTSAVAWGAATADGRMLHARNFDYQGVGKWDAEPVIAFHRPDEGQRYVSVTSAGVLMGGITAMNEAGLSLVVHQHLASVDFDVKGTPIGIAGDRIMRFAETLDDAKKLLDEHVPNGSWTYLVTSEREQAVLCYELTAKRRHAFRPAGPTFGYSNIYLAAPLDGIEAHLYPAQWRHNTGRYHRANALLEAKRGALTADDLAAILGDTGSTACRFQDGISCLVTVASVVFDARDGVVWAAEGRAPTANHPFHAFSLKSEAPAPRLGTLRGGAEKDPREIEAFEAYVDAHVAHFDRDDLPRARELLAKATEVAPGQWVFSFVAGLASLLAGDVEQAEVYLARTARLRHEEGSRRASLALWQGRVHDLRGRRTEALRSYREALLGPPPIAKAARAGLKEAYEWKPFSIEWNFGDVIAP